MKPLKQIKKYKYQILFGLFLISFSASLVLSLTPTPPICSQGCDIVQASSYATTLGIKNSVYGVFIFLILLFITVLQTQKKDKFKENIINAGIVLGSIVALYFLYIQHFILHAYCRYCLIVDFSLVLSLAVLLITWRK